MDVYIEWLEIMRDKVWLFSDLNICKLCARMSSLLCLAENFTQNRFWSLRQFYETVSRYDGFCKIVFFIYLLGFFKTYVL